MDVQDDGNGSILIREMPYDLDLGTPMLSSAKLDCLNVPGLDDQLFDHQEYFYSVTNLFVETEIEISWDGIGNKPEILSFAQTFVTVPEPSTIGLASIVGLFAIVSHIRRRN